MAKAGYCKECQQQVWLMANGSCTRGHPATSISGIHDIAVVGGECADPVDQSVNTQQVQGKSADETRTSDDTDTSIHAYRRDRRPTGSMRIIRAQPLRPSSDKLRLDLAPRLSANEAEAEAARFVGEPVTFTLEPVRNHPPYTHHLHVLEGPPHICLDYLVLMEKDTR